jgi:hypothetical protein
MPSPVAWPSTMTAPASNIAGGIEGTAQVLASRWHQQHTLKSGQSTLHGALKALGPRPSSSSDVQGTEIEEDGTESEQEGSAQDEKLTDDADLDDQEAAAVLAAARQRYTRERVLHFFM